jgi:hypothetical protein
MPPEVHLLLLKADLQRKMVAKKSAPSQYKPPLRTARARSSSPLTLDDQLLYIEKWGSKVESCKECKERGLGNRCFVARKVSSKCGNCLHAGNKCHFLTTENDVQNNDVPVETFQEETIVQSKPVQVCHLREVLILGNPETDSCRKFGKL